MALSPVVGYQGGKRRLLGRLRPLFPMDMPRYIEPFVGMGALYLDLRARGYRGPAVLADSNPCVAAFWEHVHCPQHGPALVEAATALSAEERSAERFYAMVEESVEDIERVARFLWLTNYAFANVPKVYEGDHWSRQGGTKLTSAARWGKTFPWDDCVKRLRAVVATCVTAPAVVLPEARDALNVAGRTDCIYADPPYRGQRGYRGSRPLGYVEAVRGCEAGLIVLSESPEVEASLPGWRADIGEVIARTSGGKGATGMRKEVVYIRDRRNGHR